MERIPEFLKACGNKMKFCPKGDPHLICRYKKCGFAEKDAEMLLKLTEELLEKIGQILF